MEAKFPLVPFLQQLPHLPPDMVDEEIEKFVGATAVGRADLPPNLLLQVSKPGKWAIGALCCRCEQLQCWPSDSMLHLLMVDLPKPAGGHRLIGILPTLLRL